ncbi:MAG: hypothetical protein G01um1014107_180 [Parcubacteria group bacterium Gr01-1014_107]|nr:MAG: hypothetical protein G01um1014107_180 [Parcubacteria group bacterium Gr01-1014_107]
MFELEPDEKVILKVRRHWFILFVEGFIILVLAILPPGLMQIASQLFTKFASSVNTGASLSPLLSFFYFLWLLGLWVALFIKWTDYYLDCWYITPKRIIDVEQKGLFRREVIELRFEKIQDATVEISGLIPTLLNFGDIHVQTAGAGREIILKDADNPAEAKKTISLLHEKALNRVGSSL